MSKDEEKNSKKDDDLLSMVDSLLDTEGEEATKNKSEEKPRDARKKTKVVPVIVRPPKKLKPKPIKIKRKIPREEPTLNDIKRNLKSTVDIEPKPPKKTEPAPELPLEELAETVLQELDTELTTPEVEESSLERKKISYIVKRTPRIKEEKKPKKTLPSAYKIKFGTHKKLESINLNRDIYVTCPKCNHYFESLETDDIICPKCHHEFSI